MRQMTPRQYVSEAMHLPEEIKDFHDQKDLFKIIQAWMESPNNQNKKELPNSWIDNHIYTIDCFLWFMGLHGYKLQRSKKKLTAFYELRQTLKDKKF